MFDVGQEVTVITDKGLAYNGYILERATDEDGRKAYKISLDGGGMEQMGQWHKAGDVFVLDPKDPMEENAPTSLESLVDGRSQSR
jgi:hypothetical protein